MQSRSSNPSCHGQYAIGNIGNNTTDNKQNLELYVIHHIIHVLVPPTITHDGAGL